MFQKMNREQLLKKVKRLKQRDDQWEVSFRRARAWVGKDNEQPYRPYLALVVSQKGKIVRADITDNAFSADLRFETLLQAMRRPMLGSGRARRPRVIYFDNPDDVTALAPQLAELGVRCEYRHALPMLKDALYSMEKTMRKGVVIPGLLSAPGVTVPLVEHLYRLAADFYRAMPWRCLDDRHPFEIRYPADSRPRYAVVMGSGGEVYGLAVYDKLDDLRLAFREDISPERMINMTTWLTLFFEEASAMAFDDLDAMEKYGWQAATEYAYPVFGRTTPDGTIVQPLKADTFWMEGALAAILDYLPECKRHGFTPVETTRSVKTIGGEVAVYLRAPAIDKYAV